MLIKATSEKKELVQKLSKALCTEAVYLRAPSFGYQIGPYLVTKTGDIEVPDEEANMDILRELVAGGMIDDSFDTSEAAVIITVPTKEHTVGSLMNLLHTFCSREKLLNRCVGCSHTFLMNKKFVKALDDQVPADLPEFFERLEAAGGPAINRGFFIKKDKIEVSFPYTEEPDIVNAYATLVGMINQMALTQKRVSKAIVKTENEKYTFRVWLMHLGMKGEEYKTCRKVLLKNLPGNAAFRTSDQADAAKEKFKAKREAAKEQEAYIPL